VKAVVVKKKKRKREEDDIIKASPNASKNWNMMKRKVTITAYMIDQRRGKGKSNEL
jgi:hypothetical protein